LPLVYVLGEYEKEFEEKAPEYLTLLEACNNDMHVAFDKLQSMVAEMEAYAAITGFNLKDVKCWMNIFWGKDGRIHHIGFYLKPNSRNIDLLGMKSFLSAFAMQYRLPIISKTKFSHYFSVSFPTVLTPKNNRTTVSKN
jgi:hypothetical protein